MTGLMQIGFNTDTAMARKPLKDFFEKILSDCTNDVEVGGYDRDGYDYRTNDIYFEDEGYLVEGSYDVAADIINDGDGYWTPYETIIRHAVVSMGDVTVSWCDPDTDEEEKVPESEVKELVKYLEDNIPCMVGD